MRNWLFGVVAIALGTAVPVRDRAWPRGLMFDPKVRVEARDLAPVTTARLCSCARL